MDPSVNFTLIAEKLEGYTGSDIKEVCREAVVQISHEQVRMLDQGIQIEDDWNESDSLESDEGSNISSLQQLRPVRMVCLKKGENLPVYGSGMMNTVKLKRRIRKMEWLK